MRALLAGVALAALSACTEVPQNSEQAQKVYAGREDEKAYSGDQFKGDKAKWEQSLASRADNQNEYLRGAAKK